MAIRFNWPIELHPMVVHFSVALLCFAFLLDIVAWMRGSQSARIAALYSLIGGAAATALSVLSGLITPEARERESHDLAEALAAHSFNLQRFFSGRLVEVHKHWGYVLLALVVVWLVLRLAARRRARWNGVAAGVGVLTLIALVVTGYYGGDLVYGRRGRERERGGAAPIVRTIHSVQRPAAGIP